MKFWLFSNDCWVRSLKDKNIICNDGFLSGFLKVSFIVDGNCRFDFLIINEIR